MTLPKGPEGDLSIEEFDASLRAIADEYQGAVKQGTGPREAFDHVKPDLLPLIEAQIQACGEEIQDRNTVMFYIIAAFPTLSLVEVQELLSWCSRGSL